MDRKKGEHEQIAMDGNQWTTVRWTNSMDRPKSVFTTQVSRCSCLGKTHFRGSICLCPLVAVHGRLSIVFVHVPLLFTPPKLGLQNAMVFVIIADGFFWWCFCADRLGIGASRAERTPCGRIAC